MLIDLAGKVAIVTGAGRGIGRDIAMTLAREGVAVIATDVDEPALERLERELARSGLKGYGLVCDVRNSERIAQAVGQVVAEHGRVDILVNNAGVGPGGKLESLSEEAWDENFDTNLKGVYLMCKAVAPVMKSLQFGRIINAASFAAIVPSIRAGAYAASKAGVVSLTRVLAGELAPWNITVNCYAPGMVPSALNHFAELAPGRQRTLLNTLAIRRWGVPHDVSNLVCFLASDLASYITGAMVDVSGGKLSTQIPSVAYE